VPLVFYELLHEAQQLGKVTIDRKRGVACRHRQSYRRR